MRVVSRTLRFKRPARTSRNTLLEREVYYILIEENGMTGIGEVAPIYGLSIESREDILAWLHDAESSQGQHWPDNLRAKSPAIYMGLETARQDVRNGGKRQIFDCDLSSKILINGLIWMNDLDEMLREAREKIESGFTTIKFKVGALDFEDECKMLQTVRREFGKSVGIRLDANGAFSHDTALEKLNRLAELDIHSIEQPIRKGGGELLASLCENSPIAIALDEELIGIDTLSEKRNLLRQVRPQYLVLKPSLHGAFSGCDEWIALAEEENIGWWATSALESNIGLNAIAQWVATKNNPLPQGLGTGMLYENNLPSPVVIQDGYFCWDAELAWNLKELGI